MALTAKANGTLSVADPATGESEFSKTITPSFATVTKWTGKKKIITGASGKNLIEQSDLSTVSFAWLRASSPISIFINENDQSENTTTILNVSEFLIKGAVDVLKVEVATSLGDVTVEYMFAGT